MKKTYMNPSVEVINFNTKQTLLNASMQVFDATVTDPGQLLAPELPNLPGLELPGMNLSE